MKAWAWVVAVAAAGLGARGAGAFTITPTYYDGAGQTWNDTEKAVVQAAISSWTSRLEIPTGPQNINIAFEFIHGNGELAQWTGSPVSTPTGSLPTTPGVDHVIDINADLMDPGLPNYTLFTLGDLPFANWDALTAVRHEIGHALGFTTLYTDANGQSVWMKHVTIGSGGTATFDAGGLDLSLDGSGNVVHFNHTGDISADLMSSFLPNGTRKDVSTADVQALALAYGYVAVPEPGTAAILAAGVTAALMRRRRGAA
jgi:hypothetical protein